MCRLQSQSQTYSIFFLSLTHNVSVSFFLVIISHIISLILRCLITVLIYMLLTSQNRESNLKEINNSYSFRHDLSFEIAKKSPIKHKIISEEIYIYFTERDPTKKIMCERLTQLNSTR